MPNLREAAARALSRVVGGAAIALFAIVATVALLTVAQQRSAAWVLRSREVGRLGRTALALAVDQQTALRGYLITRDSAWLAPDLRARGQIGPTLDSLVVETRDDSAQHARARRLREAVARWDSAYRVRVLTAGAQAAPDPDEREGKALFDTLRAHAAALLTSEEVRYRTRLRRDQLVNIGAFGAVLLEILVLLGLLQRVAREARRQTATVFDQQDWLAMQTATLREQTTLLEEQAAELEIQKEELGEANQTLSVALGERTEALALARTSEARFRAVVETATDAIIMSDAEGRILLWNAAATAVFGHTAGEVIGASITLLVPEDRRAAYAAEYPDIVAGRSSLLTAGPAIRDAWRKSGERFPVELAVSQWKADGETFVTSIMRDVSARAALESRLTHQAEHDALTGLANRARFRDRVGAALAREGEHPERIVVLFLDLDDFKEVNDTAGHGAGDALLTVVASRLLDATRGSDTVARLGGDEFGILLGNVERANDVDAVTARLIATMRLPFPLGDRETAVGVSIGVARGAPGLDADSLLRNADTAMYAAKRTDKGGAMWFAPAMHTALLERAEIQADLVPALERGEFWLAYQPIVALDDGRIQGVEALVRWMHPRRGPLSPAMFIPVAEASGFIVPLGRWVLAMACKAVASLPGAPYVTVNLAARQLADPHLVADVAAALAASGLPPARLVLEITETVLMADTLGTLDRLRALKAIGVRLAIDDFGTGYSSLRYLQRFPVDVLKVDKSFVDRIDADDRDAALVRTIVALGEMLGLTTVAEGIERAAQRELLHRLGCALGQGYHFAHPLDATAIAAFLEAAASRPRDATNDTR